MILNARHTEETTTPGVIEVVYDDKVVYISSDEQEEYLELQEWISNGNEVISYPNNYSTSQFILESGAVIESNIILAAYEEGLVKTAAQRNEETASQLPS
jgi:hypothetical protein